MDMILNSTVTHLRSQHLCTFGIVSKNIHKYVKALEVHLFLATYSYMRLGLYIGSSKQMIDMTETIANN